MEGELLDALQPEGIEAALGAMTELARRSEAVKRDWEHRIEQAEYEAQLARRRYEAVDPDNRLVAGNLERDWEERLREVDKLRKEYGERSTKPSQRRVLGARRPRPEFRNVLPDDVPHPNGGW